MNESWQSFWNRWYFNFFPAYRRTGGRITFISKDWREVKVKLPLNWTTRNYVGTIYGGSIYGAVDPIYMLMLIKILGSDYIVWDKSAEIHFLKPGRSTLYANCKITDKEIQLIQQGLKKHSSVDRKYFIELKDSNEVVCATITKTIYIRKLDVG